MPPLCEPLQSACSVYKINKVIEEMYLSIKKGEGGGMDWKIIYDNNFLSHYKQEENVKVIFS